MKKILWLASWYPNASDPYTGDFIERHARAASLYSQIDLLHIVKVDHPLFPGKTKTEKRQYGEGARATITYYHSPHLLFSWLEKLHSNYLYLKLHKDYFTRHIRENGKPDAIHVHIALKAGIAALFLKWRYHVPYVVSEHWSALCPESKPNFDDRPFLFRWIWKLIMKQAMGYSAVSAYLADSMRNRFGIGIIDVIPNVVDKRTFFPSGKIVQQPRFIHISTLAKFQKNVLQILEAASMVILRVPDFELMIFGLPDESLVQSVRAMNLEKVVIFKGMCPQEILRTYLQDSMALILYSNYETFGCVIIEANACGIPVVVSDIPVFHENVVEAVTGVFVPLNQPQTLAETLYAIANHQYIFPTNLIQQWATDHYSFEKVGKLFAEFYEKHG